MQRTFFKSWPKDTLMINLSIKQFAILLLLLLLFSTTVSSQNNDSSKITNHKKSFFIDFYVGTQISGIRKEDYVVSKLAPYTQITFGKWITPYIALAANYQGPFFNYISDNYRHKYLYIDGNVVFNISTLTKTNYKLLNIHTLFGAGYFHNFFYGHPNICSTIGISNDFNISENISIKLKIGAIMGWDIYQGNADILTNISIGITKSF